MLGLANPSSRNRVVGGGGARASKARNKRLVCFFIFDNQNYLFHELEYVGRKYIFQHML